MNIPKQTLSDIVVNARSFIRSILFLLLLALSLGLINYSLRYFDTSIQTKFLLRKEHLRHSLYFPAFYTHITSAGFVLLLGLFQFFAKTWLYRIRLHRLLGKIYVFLVLFAAAPSGLVMAVYASGGIWVNACFILLSLLWWTFTFISYQSIRQCNVTEHGNYMLRSYALTISAIMLRLYGFVFTYILGSISEYTYGWLAWLSWVPNLLLIELIIHNQKKQNSA
ncbi:MAG: DUF2306 domain-containing protein [Cytophagales bacterium]